MFYQGLWVLSLFGLDCWSRGGYLMTLMLILNRRSGPAGEDGVTNMDAHICICIYVCMYVGLYVYIGISRPV